MSGVAEAPDEAARRSQPFVGRGLLTLAIVLGVGIGPGIAAGASLPGSAAPVVTAACLIALTAVGVVGIGISVVRWIGGRRRSATPGGAGAPAPAAAEFSTVGQRASFALAGIELLILVVAAPAALVLHRTGPQDGPGKDVSAILVAALALIAISALVVPTIAAQVAWTWRRAVPDAEAAVLSGAVPGRRRLILAARAVAVTAWVISTAGAGVTSGFLIDEAAERLQAVAGAYSSADAADAVRGELLDAYVVGDIRCPDSLPDPGRDSTFTCRVTSLDRTTTVRAKWFASGYGTGGVNVIDPAHADLTRVADLPDEPPTAVPLAREASGAEVVAAVRSQLIAEGRSRSSRAVRDLRCPGIGAEYAGFVRCTIGRDPETQRYLDVYPVAQGRFRARTAEIADLPR